MNRFALAGVALALLPALAVGQEAKTLIEKAIAAHGSKAPQDGEGLTWKTKGLVFTQGLELPISGKTVRMYPNRARQDLEIEVQGNTMKMAVAINGKSGWMMMNENLQEMPESQLLAGQREQHAQYCALLVPLLKGDLTIAVAEPAEVAGKKCPGVKVTGKDRPDVLLYFDPESNFLVKTAFKSVDAQTGNDIDQEMFFSDFKEQAGQKRPTKLMVKRDGEKYIELEISDYEILPKVDPKQFEKPKD